MNEQIHDFNDLISKAGHYLKSELSYALKTISEFRKDWRQIRDCIVAYIHFFCEKYCRFG